MSSCQNCQLLLLALKTEIEDRQQREHELQCANDNLMYLLNTSPLNLGEQIDWKERYEKQREINSILQSKITKQKKQVYFLSEQKRNSVYQPSVSLFTTKRSSSKENASFKHDKKMSEMMKTLVIEKAKQRQYSSQRSKRDIGPKQIILRIVDERLNRQF